MRVDEYLAAPDGERESKLAGLTAAELLALGVELFNAGRFFEAHEAWEAVWLEAPRELRAFYQGLIQVAAAFVHLTRDEYPGTVKLLAEGIGKLEAYPASFMGLDLAALVAAAAAVRQRAVALGARRLEEIDAGLLPRIEASTTGR